VFLTGGPGTGKSHTLQLIIKALRAKKGEGGTVARVRLAARASGLCYRAARDAGRSGAGGGTAQRMNGAAQLYPVVRFINTDKRGGTRVRLVRLWRLRSTFTSRGHARAARCRSLNPKPQTPGAACTCANSKPSTLDPKPRTRCRSLWRGRSRCTRRRARRSHTCVPTWTAALLRYGAGTLNPKP
jgi:hypothetical protein